MGKFSDLIAEASDAPAYFDADSAIGDTITGRITAISLRQTRDFKTKKPETWEDGAPREQFILVLNSDLHQHETDDGKRSVYVKWWGKWRKSFAKAFLDAAALHGSEAEPEIGGTLTVTYVGEGEAPSAGMSPAKLFEYSYTPPGVPALEATTVIKTK